MTAACLCIYVRIFFFAFSFSDSFILLFCSALLCDTVCSGSQCYLIKFIFMDHTADKEKNCHYHNWNMIKKIIYHRIEWIFVLNFCRWMLCIINSYPHCNNFSFHCSSFASRCYFFPIVYRFFHLITDNFNCHSSFQDTWASCTKQFCFNWIAERWLSALWICSTFFSCWSVSCFADYQNILNQLTNQTIWPLAKYALCWARDYE